MPSELIEIQSLFKQEKTIDEILEEENNSINLNTYVFKDPKIEAMYLKFKERIKEKEAE